MKPRTSRFFVMNSFLCRSLAVVQLALLGSLGAPAGWAAALPTGGTALVGNATFANPNANTLDIHTYQDRTVLGFVDFSIGAGNTVNILQPGSSSMTMAKVSGGNVSEIYGTLNSNGGFILINPNGVLVGPGGVVNTQSFTASTLDLSNTAFLAGGSQTFSGTSTAGVTNLGDITANGGDIFLIAKHVSNSGTLTAANGTVGLAAGTQVTLAESGQNLLSVRYDAGARDGVGIANSGTIAALKSELVANGNIYSLAVNNTGLIRATGVSNVGGRVRITASGGTAANSGTIVATNGTQGGEIDLTGNDVQLASTSVLDASGANGGGTVKVGGGSQGQDATIANAQTVTAEAGSQIKADATDSGDGGTVVVWSDGMTRYAGTISARGGPNGGNGGSVEVSGLAGFDYTGQTDTRAPKGTTGSLLLDPTDLYIYDNTIYTKATETVLSWQTIQSNLGSSNLTIQTTAYASGANDNGNIHIVDGYTLNASGTLTFSAAGAITVEQFNQSALGTNTGTGLVVKNTGSGGLVLRADSKSYGVNPTSVPSDYTLGLTVGSAVGGHGTVTVNGTINWGGSVTVYYDPATDYSTPVTYTNAGAGALTSYMLVNTGADLTSVASTGSLSGNYYLAQNITMTGSWTPVGTDSTHAFSGIFDGGSHTITGITVNSGNTDVGFFGYLTGTVKSLTLAGESVTGTAASAYVGGIAGEASGATVSGVTINGTSPTVTDTAGGAVVGGLFGRVSGGAGSSSISGTNAASVSGATAGGLIGAVTGTVLVSGTNSGTVNGTAIAGGLVGDLGGTSTLKSGTNTGAVTGSGSVGGLVGTLTTTGTYSSSYKANITQSINKGSVSGGTDVGGLVGVVGTAGNSSGVISDSYNTGSVTGNSANNATAANSVGGLVGDNYGSIFYSYNYGAVQAATGSTVTYGGGLVGVLESTGLLQNSANAGKVWATSASTRGTITYAGALVGSNLADSASTGAGSSAYPTSGIWTTYYGSSSYGSGISSAVGTEGTAAGSAARGTAGDSGFDSTFSTDSTSSSWYSVTSKWTRTQWSATTTWSTSIWNFSAGGLPIFVSGGGGGGGNGNNAIHGDPNPLGSTSTSGGGVVLSLGGGRTVTLSTSVLQPAAQVSNGAGDDSTVGASSLGGFYSLAGTKPFGTPVLDNEGGHREYAPNFEIPTLPGALQHVRTISSTSNEGVSFGGPVFGGTHGTMSYTDPNH